MKALSIQNLDIPLGDGSQLRQKGRVPYMWELAERILNNLKV